MRLPPPALPVEAALPELEEALAGPGAAVLVAPPGAGKTTRVPLALLDAAWLGDGGILVLEPRRLAARAAARRMASTLGEGVGERVGYRVRMESRVGPRTRIEVVTEGILTRRLVQDPALDGVGLVVFDEVHERSLHADLGLALTLQSRALLRPDLRVLAMSATLDGAAVAAVLGEDAPVVRSEGRLFSVETRWLARPEERRTDAAVAAAVRRALAEEPTGDVLAFLPGAPEIRRCAALLEGALPEGVYVAPLYGDLALEDQDRALVPAGPGRRKVVLATSIAETSLTVEGVRVVVDAGLARRPRFDAPSGLTKLETVPASQAAAEQRRGRAGRTQPGVCYRLWTAAEHAHRAPFDTPEILHADLAPLALDLAAWGAAPDELRWLDPPPPAAFAGARDLLHALGALDAAGALTQHGRAMATLPLHPRLAHMALRARPLGLAALAADVAALAAGRDPFRPDARGLPPDPDLRLRLDALAGRTPPGAGADRHALDALRREAADLRRQMGVRPGDTDRRAPAATDDAALLLALAYPDRIAGRTRPGRFRLRNGRGATVPDGSPLADAPFLAVGPLGGTHGAGGDARVYLAAPLTAEEIERHFGDDIETREEVAWDDGTGRVVARRTRTLDALVLWEKGLPAPDPAQITAALLDAVRRRGLETLPWSKGARALQQRVLFLRHHLGEAWPDLSDAALLEALDSWLGPYLAGARGLADLARLDLPALLLDAVPGPRRAELDRLAPTHLDVPSGSRLPLDYSDPEAPALAVRLQEVFGLEATPRLAGGRVPVVMHLLSPAQRPVQITRDLAGFWRSSYFDVRKDLRGRYPKHHWPENPLEATPTARAKRRGE